jgi:GcrA cell cycle regulator
VQSDNPWTDIAVARLRSLWNDGLSTSAIGRALNLSKNAVIGKAHRLALPARPCPIRRPNDWKQKRIRKSRPVISLPPLAAPVSLLPGSDVCETRGETGKDTVATPGASAPAFTPEIEKPRYRISQCCWPIGDPGTPTFRFCDAPSLPGKPYCPEHASTAYVKASSSGRNVGWRATG